MAKHYKLLIGLVLGLLAGVLLHPYADNETLKNLNTHFLQPIGQVFLRIIFMIVVPMIFSAMIMGVYELSRGHSLGKVASKTLIYTLVASTLSVIIGISLVNVLKPGAGFSMDPNLISEQTAAVTAVQKNAAAAKPLSQTLVELIPRNPLDAAVRAFDGEMIAFMVFSLIFGIALCMSTRSKDETNPLIAVLERIYEACLKIVDFAMKLAPLAVFALVFNTAFKFGTDIFGSLIGFVAVVIVGLLLQQFVVYGIMLKAAGYAPLKFFSACKDVYLYAFSTASSNATLPKSLETAEHKLLLPPRISRFVLTVGSTANQNGTALFEGVTVLFLAQVYNVDLSLAQQIQVVLMSILAGIGTAGVPGGSLPLIMILLVSVGIPAEGLGLILGVDRFLDMCRTTINVSGDLVIAALVAKSSPQETETVNG